MEKGLIQALLNKGLSAQEVIEEVELDLDIKVLLDNMIFTALVDADAKESLFALIEAIENAIEALGWTKSYYLEGRTPRPATLQEVTIGPYFSESDETTPVLVRDWITSMLDEQGFLLPEIRRYYPLDISLLAPAPQGFGAGLR